MEAIFDQIECSFLQINRWLIYLGHKQDNFGSKISFLGHWGGIYFRTLVTSPKLRIIAKIEDYGCIKDIILANHLSLTHSGNEGKLSFPELRINPHFWKAFFRAKVSELLIRTIEQIQVFFLQK